MTVLLHSVLTVTCYNQHFLISILPPVNSKSAWPNSISNQHFTLTKSENLWISKSSFYRPPGRSGLWIGCNDGPISLVDY